MLKLKLDLGWGGLVNYEVEDMKIYLVVAPSLQWFYTECLERFKVNKEETHVEIKRARGEVIIDRRKRFIFVNHPEKMRGFNNAEVLFWGPVFNLPSYQEFRSIAHSINRQKGE